MTRAGLRVEVIALHEFPAVNVEHGSAVAARDCIANNVRAMKIHKLVGSSSAH